VSPEIKTIPSKHIRSLIIKGVSQFVPVIDIVTVLTKTTPGLKKVYNCHIPTYPGVSQGVFLLDYLTHEHAMKALESINAKKKLSPIKGNIEAFVAEPLVDNVENIMKDVTRVFAFENLHIGNVNVFEFKQFIEEYVKSCVIEDDDDDDNGDYHMNSRSSIIVHRIRQYANKIVVEFNKCPKMLNDVNIGITIYINSSTPITNREISLFGQNHNLTVIRTNLYHDRFIIIDDELYNIGSSIKDIGKKISHISKLESINIDELLNKY
jgi:hypothetical protein